MFKFLKNKFKHILVSLRFTILSIFITLFLLTTISIIAIRSIVVTDEVNYTSIALMNYVSEAVLRELTVGIRPVEMECKFSANLLQSGVLKDDESQLVPYTYYLVNTMPLVRGAFWGDEFGNFIYSHKENNGSITSEVISRTTKLPFHKIIHRDLQGNVISEINSTDMRYDPRLRPWYIATKQKKQTIWTDIYEFFYAHVLGITAGSPVFDKQGQLRGVFGADVSLDYLTQFITGQKVTQNGYSFIITKDENLVAYPLKPPFTQTLAQPHKLVNVHKIALPLIDQSIDLYNKTGNQALEIVYKNKTYLVTYQIVPDLAQHGWLIGVVTPRSDFIGFLKEMNLITIIVSLCILALAVIIVSNLVSRIVKPIHALVKQTEKIKRFELDKDTRIHSHIKEVVQLGDAIRSMKQGLKHFQLYLPKTLVQQLIASGNDIRVGGERKQLVVFFSDIQGFTTIAERMDPNQLMAQICEYFEVMSQVIIKEKGTIDKYIGDSIMAFWGAPLPENEPWYRAANAALQCEQKLDGLNVSWQKQGKPELITRIGIHMGDAIVGNVGSSERLNYTALGDTINMTSRLEDINKIYKTKIIVSDVMYKHIKDRFVLRLVDCVIVTGRTKPIYIYELLGDNAIKLAFDIKLYDAAFARAFQAYEQQHWNEALTHFRECLNIYPADNLAPIFIERCERLGSGTN